MSYSDLSTVKGKLNALYSGTYRNGAFSDVSDPIADEIRDLERAKQFAYLYPIVPFFDQADATLMVFRKLAMLTPTAAGVINSIKHFAIGGGLEVIRKPRTGFRRREEEVRDVTIQEHNTYLDILDQYINGETLQEIMELRYNQFMTYGNIFMEFVQAQTLGVSSYGFHVHDSETVRYLITHANEDKIALVSALWNPDYLTRYAPAPLPLYPNTVEDEFGAFRSMYHTKNNVAGYDWYGVPLWASALYYVYMEMQLGQYTTEGYAGSFLGEVFMETEMSPGEYSEDEEAVDDQYESDFDSAMSKVFTNRGNRQAKKRVLHRQRPVGSQPTFVHEFKKQTEEKFHETTAILAETEIFKAFDWHPMFLVAVAGKLGMSSEFYEMVKYKQGTIIRYIQQKVLTDVQKCIDFIMEQNGHAEQLQFSLAFTNLFEDINKMEEEVEANTTAAPDDPQEPTTPDDGNADE